MLALKPGENVFDRFDDANISLKQLGCSTFDYDTATYREARDVADFSRFAYFATLLFPLVLATIATAVAVYGIVRAIGWVLRGFAAS
jgi:hypothetical protein